MQGRSLALVAALLVFAAGPASAAWHAVGSQEPSTRRDVDDRMMYTEADAAPGASRVYFNAFQTVEGTSLNPNVGALGSDIAPPGPAHHRAMLGLWKDCNDDGHVGLAESALLEYRAELLFDDSACPPGTRHNDAGWVSEMIGIGMVDPCEWETEAIRTSHCNGLPEFHENEHVLYANGTMVWGDVGEPGAVPPAECPLAPPPGTTSGTGLLLAYVDCQTAGKIGEAFAASGLDPGLLDPSLPATLFGTPTRAGLLEHDSGAPAATVWDCASPRALVLHDPTGQLDALVLEDPTGGGLTGEQPAMPVIGKATLFEDADNDDDTPGTRTVAIADEGHLLWLPQPAPAVHDPTTSSWDAAEHAADGPRGDCDDESALRPYAPGPLVESGAPVVGEARKDRASLAFTFYDGHRGINERIDFLLGPTAPSDLGLPYHRHGRGGAGPLWSADAPSVNAPQLVTRGTLEFSGAAYWTYYATLGSAVFDAGALVPTNEVRTYGSEACGENDEGVHGGWECDADAWWIDALGNDARPRYLRGEPYAPVPGQLYHLRDVDCYDGHVAAGVYAGATLLAETPC